MKLVEVQKIIAPRSKEINTRPWKMERDGKPEMLEVQKTIKKKTSPEAYEKRKKKKKKRIPDKKIGKLLA